MGTIIGAFIGGLLAIGVAVLIYKRVRDKETAAEPPLAPAPAAPPTPDPKSELKSLMDSLIRLNITIRTTFGLPTTTIELIEQIVDYLRATVPRMIERHPAETLTYELKRISGEHLATIVKEFLDLSPESRDRHQDAFVGSLGDIRDQVRRAAEIVEQNEQAEFKVMASFLKTKYSADGV
ncbi:MAG: hypothetical protein GY859_36920 [Desulfobacterales bacterium]|nr:hypothetical protein [Desulfobacterales bacterium]